MKIWINDKGKKSEVKKRVKYDEETGEKITLATITSVFGFIGGVFAINVNALVGFVIGLFYPIMMLIDYYAEREITYTIQDKPK